MLVAQCVHRATTSGTRRAGRAAGGNRAATGIDTFVTNGFLRVSDKSARRARAAPKTNERRQPEGGGVVGPNVNLLAGDPVAALTGVAARALDLQAHLLAEGAGDESAHRVRLPVGGLLDFGHGRAALAAQHV